MRRRGGFRNIFVIAVAAAALTAVAASPAAAATFTVNSTDDAHDAGFGFGHHFDGRCDADTTAAGRQCTLRAALEEANSTRVADTIEFNISGGGIHTITSNTSDPGFFVVANKTTINGYTQPGASPNTLADPTVTNAKLKIQLAGAYSGIKVVGEKATGSVIKGLSIGGSAQQGIQLDGADGTRVQGNFLGVAADGVTGTPNSMGVGIANLSGAHVGGAKPAARNVISANNLIGVYFANYGIDSLVVGNLIGLDRDGSALGNGGDGIRIGLSHGDSFLSNAIYSNGGLGIDLGGGGVTPNDGDNPSTDPIDPDMDAGSNNFQNYPVLTYAQILHGGGSLPDTVSGAGTLDSVRSTAKHDEDYIVQFFVSPSADGSGYGEGRIPAGQKKVTTNRQGHADFQFALSGDFQTGWFVTATATRLRTGDTSEFSQARVITEAVTGP